MSNVTYSTMGLEFKVLCELIKKKILTRGSEEPSLTFPLGAIFGIC